MWPPRVFKKNKIDLKNITRKICRTIPYLGEYTPKKQDFAFWFRTIYLLVYEKYCPCIDFNVQFIIQIIIPERGTKLIAETSLIDTNIKHQEIANKKMAYHYKCLPMLKWAGGKRRLLKYLMPLVDAKPYNNYFEPFFGGGALFFATQPQSAFLSDTNDELINCYRYVRDNCDEVIEVLQTMENTKENYYRIRSEVPIDGLLRAARIIYLTTLSFNGIYRLNQKNQFNVPYGNKTHLNPCDKDRLRSVSKALSYTKLECCDFEESVSRAKKDDLIYFDPPYAISSGEGFVKYNSKIFTWNDQKRLASIAQELVLAGCQVIVSNADVPEIRDLYKGFSCQEIERVSVIAASGEYRKKITECIFYNEV